VLGHINDPRGGLDAAYYNPQHILCCATGNGDGTFTPAPNYGCPLQDPNTLEYTVLYGQITLADISGDAKDEAMAFSDHKSAENVAFFRYDSGGFPMSGFNPHPSFRRTGSTSATDIVARDLDRDG